MSGKVNYRRGKLKRDENQNNIKKKLNKKRIKRNKNILINLKCIKKKIAYMNKNNKFNKIILCITIILLFCYFISYTNAIQIWVENKAVAVIKKNKTIKSDDIKAAAASKLAKEIGSNVYINENIKIKYIKARKKNINTVDEALINIINELTYEVEAASILVDGKEVVVVSSSKEAEEIYHELLKPYKQEDLNIVKTYFKEKVEIKTKMVDRNEIKTKDEAFDILSKSKEKKEKYKIKPKDTLLGIALKSGMSLKSLLELNKELTEKSKLKVNDEITISISVPFLNVITEEEVQYTEIMKKNVIKKINENEDIKFSKVVKSGSDGEKIVKAKIIRINGFEDKKVIVDEKVVKEPITEIIEIGTKKCV